MDNPQEVIDAAKPGDTVYYQLRGPATEEEIRETVDVLEKTYLGIKFIVTDGGSVSNAYIKWTNNG